MKSTKAFLVAVVILFCMSLAKAKAQLPGEYRRVLYDTGSEKGSVTLRPNGLFEWDTPGQARVSFQLSIDLGRDLRWLGTGRRFIVAGLHTPLSQGRLLLVELSSLPPAIQVLSTVSGVMDIYSLFHSAAHGSLYSFDIINAEIRTAPYNAASNVLPSFSDFSFVLGVVELPILSQRLGLGIEEPFSGQSSGATLWNSLLTSDIPYRFENINGAWVAAEGEPIPPEQWTGPAFFGPSQGPLYSYVPARAYEVVRDDLPGGPEVVSSGDFGLEGDPPIGQVVTLNIPAGGLVPGASYHIDNVEVVQEEFPILSSDRFVPLFRSGYNLDGAGVHMGQGFTSNRSEFGSTAFKAAVAVDWIEPQSVGTQFSLFLYWALKDQTGQPPIAGFGNTALLTNPLGVFVRNVILGDGNLHFRFLSAPLTDPRLSIGDLIYFQFAMAIDASTVVLSDVFATTIFEPLGTQSSAVTGGNGLQSVQGALRGSGLGLDPVQREVWERARDMLKAKRLLETGK